MGWQLALSVTILSWYGIFLSHGVENDTAVVGPHSDSPIRNDSINVSNTATDVSRHNTSLAEAILAYGRLGETVIRNCSINETSGTFTRCVTTRNAIPHVKNARIEGASKRQSNGSRTFLAHPSYLDNATLTNLRLAANDPKKTNDSYDDASELKSYLTENASSHEPEDIDVVPNYLTSLFEEREDKNATFASDVETPNANSSLLTEILLQTRGNGTTVQGNISSLLKDSSSRRPQAAGQSRFTPSKLDIDNVTTATTSAEHRKIETTKAPVDNKVFKDAVPSGEEGGGAGELDQLGSGADQTGSASTQDSAYNADESFGPTVGVPPSSTISDNSNKHGLLAPGSSLLQKGGRADSSSGANMEVERKMPHDSRLHPHPTPGRPQGRRAQPTRAAHGLMWQERQYLLSVLVPIGCGILGALLIVCAAYAVHTCNNNNAGKRFSSAPIVKPEPTPRIDQILLLADSSDEDM